MPSRPPRSLPALLGAAIVLPVLASAGLAQDCIEYGEYLHWLGRTETGATVLDVQVVDGLACVRQQSTYQDQDVAFHDATDPRQLVRLSLLDLPGGPTACALDGDLAYVCTNLSELHVVDVGTPTAPVLRGSLTLEYQGTSVVAAGDHLYVGEDFRFAVIDVSDPDAPAQLASLDIYAFDLALGGGDLVYAAAAGDGVHVIDVSVPAAPAVTGGAAAPVDLLAIGLDGGWLAAGGGWGPPGTVVAYDLADPLAPVLVGEVAVPRAPLGLAVAGSVAHVADQVAGLCLIDLAAAGGPALVSDHHVAHAAQDVQVVGDVAFVAGGSHGVETFDVGAVAMPGAHASDALPHRPYGVTVTGGLAYTAYGTGYGGGLVITDLSDPAAPDSVGAVDLPDLCWDVAVAAGHAYVAAVDGLHVIDVGDPATPVAVGSLVGLGEMQGVAVAGTRLLVADDGYGLRTYDIGDPAAPVGTGNVQIPGAATSVAVTGDHAVVASNVGLYLVSLAGWPSRVGSLELTDGGGYGVSFLDVVASGDVAYATTRSPGDLVALVAVDVADPTQPAVLAQRDLWGWGEGLALAGDLLHVAARWTESGAFQVLDVADPAAPVLLGGFDHVSGWQARDVAVEDDLVVGVGGGATDGTLGALLVLPPECPLTGVADRDPTRVALQAVAAPNPCGGATTIRFALPAAGAVRLELFDLAGRRIRTLRDGHLPAGPHRARWDGRDARGARVAEGVYLYRLDTSYGRRTGRVTLVR